MTSLTADFLLFAVTAVLFTLHNSKKATAQSCEADGSQLRNSAFVFVKPHANTVMTQQLVREKLIQSGIAILSERDIDGKTIDEKKLIDQHYYAIGTFLES
jgi:hypothetical protein